MAAIGLGVKYKNAVSSCTECAYMTPSQRYSFWREQLSYNHDPWDKIHSSLSHQYHPYGWPTVSQRSLLPFASLALLYANRSIVRLPQHRPFANALVHIEYMDSYHRNALRTLSRTIALNVKHVLVVGDAPFPHTSVMSIWNRFPTNITWWCTNPAQNLSGINIFPRGIANALNWAQVLRSAPAIPLKSQLLHCGYMNLRTNPKRRSKLQALQNNGFQCNASNVDFATSAASLRASHFVASPRGNGPQNHRDWEALMMGAIPIVDYDPITEPLWTHLPVVRVSNWSIVTPTFLWSTLAEMRQREYNYETMDISYYVNTMGLGRWEELSSWS